MRNFGASPALASPSSRPAAQSRQQCHLMPLVTPVSLGDAQGLQQQPVSGKGPT